MIPQSSGNGRLRRVVMTGWYGMGNLGDEVILQSIVSQLRSRIRNVSITVLSERPYQLRGYSGVKSLRITKRRLNSARRILAIARADIFILGGGGILMDYGRKDTNISRWLEDMEIAQKLRVPSMTWGVGVGRIWTDESKKWIRKVLPRSDGVFVRNRESALALSSFGIEENVSVSYDPALMLPDLNEFEGKHSIRPLRKDKPVVLVCLRHWYVDGNWTFNEEVFSKTKSSLAELLSYLSHTRGASVVFVPLRAEEPKKDDDREVEDEVRSLIDADCQTVLVDHVPQSREFMQLISDSDLLIGMRLHSLILASAIGVPCIGISYDDKVRNYMSSIGAGDWALSMEAVSFESLRRLADDALNGVYPGTLIRSLIGARKESAEADIDRAVTLVERGSSWRLRAERYLRAITLTIEAAVARKRPVRKTG
jgi:polysaccharide pyruvyl transferase CsaB